MLTSGGGKRDIVLVEGGGSPASRPLAAGARAYLRGTRADGDHIVPTTRHEDEWPDDGYAADRLFASSCDAMAILDSRGRLTRVNPAFQGATGFPTAALIGNRWVGFIHAGDRALVVSTMQASLDSLIAARVECRHLCAGGGFKWLDCSISGDRGSNSLFVVARDVTDAKRAHDGLVERESHYRELVESLPEIVFEMDTAGRLTYASRGTEYMLGYTALDIESGLNVFDLLVPEDRERAMENVGRRLTRTSFPAQEYRVIKKNGEVTPVLVYASPIFRHGEPVGMRGLLVDIADRKKVEQALRDSEELYRNLVETSPDAIVLSTLETIATCNARTAVLLGFDSPQELVGRSVLEFIVPEMLDLAVAKMGEVAATGSVRDLEISLMTRDGRRVGVEASASLIRDVDGAPRGMITILRDITQRKQAADELLTLRKAVEASSEVIFLANREGVITYTNPEFHRLYGHRPEDVIGLKTPRILKSGLVPAEAYQQFWQAITSKNVVKGQILNKTEDGRLLTIESSTNPIVDERGDVTGFLAIQRDVTEQEVAREALLQRVHVAALTTSVNAALIHGGTVRDMLQQCAQAMVTNLDAAFARIWTLNQDEQVLELQASAGIYTRIDGSRSRMPVGTGSKVGIVAAERRTKVTNDVQNDPLVDGEWARSEGLISSVVAPLLVDDCLVGVAATFARHPLSDVTLQALESVSDAIALGIKRKRAEENVTESLGMLRRTFERTIDAVATIVETRDPYTAGHQQRVADLAWDIAKQMGLSEEQAGVARLAAAVHDIGKISVPSEILARPGALGDAEFQLVKAHSRVGFEILKNIDFPWPIAKIVLQHHERMNGSGYPNALKGPEILLEARIIAVADVVEAMSFHRPYRPALGLAKAVAEITEQRATLYDPDVVDACLKVVGDRSTE